MNHFLSQRAQDEICEQLIKDYEGLYYPYKPVDIVGLAKALSLDLRYVTFCNDGEARLGFYADGKTPTVIMTGKGPAEKIFPQNTVLISRSLEAPARKSKFRFTLAHEVYHHIESLLSGEAPVSAYSTEIEPRGERSIDDFRRIMNYREIQADRGAAALLMPRKLVVNTCRTMMDDKPICVYGNDNFDDDTYDKLHKIADFMEVSLTALIIRLKHLRLLEKHDLGEFTYNVKLCGGAQG